jgi:hypothetical protein
MVYIFQINFWLILEDGKGEGNKIIIISNPFKNKSNA